MSIIEIIVLALIQGLTEFLPISSSAHLILPSQIFGWQDQGLAFDVAVHVGSLAAVLIYFRKEVADILGAWFKSFGKQGSTDDSRLGWWIIVATIPGLVIGFWPKIWSKTFPEAPGLSRQRRSFLACYFGMLMPLQNRPKPFIN